MYAGTTFNHGSGKIIGVHQKIDRVARRCLKPFLKNNNEFPDIKTIIHFEGINGPDGLKRKSPSVDEPWHFIDPVKSIEQPLIMLINDHIFNLTNALKTKNDIRAAFEASWLAHAIVDGLTPAHHYPMDEKIEELWGKSHDERGSFKNKTLIKGTGGFDTISKNWEYWGAGGVLTNHLMFEFGVASAISTDRFKDCSLTNRDIIHLKRVGFDKYYFETVQKIAALNIYNEFDKTGWTVSLANTTKDILLPSMIKMVALAWYQATINLENSHES